MGYHFAVSAPEERGGQSCWHCSPSLWYFPCRVQQLSSHCKTNHGAGVTFVIRSLFQLYCINETGAFNDRVTVLCYKFIKCLTHLPTKQLFAFYLNIFISQQGSLSSEGALIFTLLLAFHTEGPSSYQIEFCILVSASYWFLDHYIQNIILQEQRH